MKNVTIFEQQASNERILPSVYSNVIAHAATLAFGLLQPFKLSP